MTAGDRPDAVTAATAFIQVHFPECLCAFVAGSMFRGEETPTSDLDIVVITTRDDAPFRASYREHGWPIEAFVHTVESYPRWFVNDGNRPSLAFMVDEGEIVRDTDGLAARVKADARTLLERGPEPLTPSQIEDLRYAVTDALDDFIGCNDVAEGVFVAAALASRSSELILLLNHQWIGSGKWVLRALRRSDPALAVQLSRALRGHARYGDKRPLIAFARRALDDACGPLFEGYHRSGKRT
jgi:predicted nucleotidyltransferase